MFEPPYRMKNMMPGMIMLWYGSAETIPTGWHLCDGTMGTPDLRDKFVPCAGGTYDPNETGGSSAHTHTYTSNSHSHSLRSGAHIAQGTYYMNLTGVISCTGTTDSENHIPEYHALCYIMKLN